MKLMITLVLTYALFGLHASEKMCHLCTSCDISGSETTGGSGLSLDQCKSKCLDDASCRGIDFGKGGRAGECYLNHGENVNFGSHDSFDGYSKNSDCGEGRWCDTRNGLRRNVANCGSPRDVRCVGTGEGRYGTAGICTAVSEYVSRCTDIPNYKDKYGKTCEGYTNGACRNGNPGEANEEQLGEAANSGGVSPLDACCVCGGGEGCFKRNDKFWRGVAPKYPESTECGMLTCIPCPPEYVDEV